MEKKKLIIWDSDDPPPTGDWLTILWRSYDTAGRDNVISIPRLVEENTGSLRARYLAWIYDLGEAKIKGKRIVDHLEIRPSFSCWWMTLPATVSYGESTMIYTMIRLMAFEGLVCKSDFCSIELHSVDSVLKEVLLDWANKVGIKIFPKTALKSSPKARHVTVLRRLFRVLPPLLQGLGYLLHYLIERWPLRATSSFRRNNKTSLLLVDYLIHLSPDALIRRRFSSQYWTKLVDILRKTGTQVTWVHHYIKHTAVPSCAEAVRLLGKWNKDEGRTQVHATLDSVLDYGIILCALWDFIKIALKSGALCRALENSPRGSHFNFAPIFLFEWIDNLRGKKAMSNCLMLNLWEKMLRSVPTQSRGLYLQENQPWEMAFIHSWKIAGHGELIGVPHATILDWDTRYFYDVRSYVRKSPLSLPMPDLVAVNGPAMMSKYVNGGYPASELKEVEALRYLYLEDLNRVSPLARESETCLRVLVITDYFAEITRSQLVMLQKALPLIEEPLEIIVKPHPSCPVRMQDFPGMPMRVVSQPLETLWEGCDVVFSGNLTSAAVEAYEVGLPVVSVVDGRYSNQSSLRRCEGALFASTPEELAKAFIVATATAHSPKGKRTFFTLDSKLSRWRELLSAV